jgi:hypothetical protein
VSRELEAAAAAGDPKAIADRVERALERADERLVELGLLPPKRTRAEKRSRKAGRRLPNDGQPGETEKARQARRKAKARAKRKGRR